VHAPACLRDGIAGLTVRQLAEEVGTSSQAVLRACQRLRAFDLIETLRDGKFVRSYPTDGLGRFVARRASGLPAQYARVEAALGQAGSPCRWLAGRGRTGFPGGPKGRRREFKMRPDARLPRHQGVKVCGAVRRKPILRQRPRRRLK